MNRVPCIPTARTSIARHLFASLLAPAAFFACSVLPSAAQDAPLRYVRAKDGGAKLYNLADKTSLEIGSVTGKTLLEVYGERAGYLSVDAPAGFEVWVFGEYVKTTPLAGTVEITGDTVFMRPVPKSDPSAYPLEQRLHMGDRVHVVGRSDPKKPLDKDWVRIVSPPGTRAWVLASDTTAVDPKEDAQAAWAAAVKTDRSARPTYDIQKNSEVAAQSGDAKSASEAGAPKAGTESTKAADASFAAAEALYVAAKAKEGSDWAPVRAAYQGYLDKNPDGAMAAQARTRLVQVDAYAEIESIRNDRTLHESQRGDTLADAERRLREANLSQDPLWGRFQARGKLVREQPVASDPPRFVVYWADKPTAEIVCTSGKYDLSAFENSEIGVQGAVLRSAVQGTDTVAPRPGRIDASRIEVLAAGVPH